MKLSDSLKSEITNAGLAEQMKKQPVLAILLISLAAIALNCFPIIFCGKSFVAPAWGVPMLYERYPTLPGMTNTVPVEAHGSDTGAMEIWGVPVGFIQSRSIWEHGEIPLWNRYSHAGDTLIGQAISMIGDPLQWIVIAGHGSSIAWDIKFVLAKLLFAIGFGLLIRRLFGGLALPLIFSTLAAYCGAYYYIYNHPVFFVFSYAPWILLSALELLDLQSKNYFRWGLVWLVVNFGCFNGGHVEPAIVVIGGMNLAALVFALVNNRGIVSAAKVLLRLGIGTVIFLFLTAPIWLSFLSALQGAFSLHSEVRVTQYPFAKLLGIFDDVFFRLPVNETIFMAPGPASSFLIFVGAAYSFVRFKFVKNEPFFWINIIALGVWGGCVFGWVPSAVIAAVPLLNRVGHTNTDFSYLLVIHLTIQCAYGFRCFAREENLRQRLMGLLWVAVILVGITALYLFGAEHGPFFWSYYAIVAIGAFAAPLLYSFLKNRGPLTAAGIAGIALLSFIPNFRFGMYPAGHPIMMIPGDRVTLNAPSPAIEKIKTDRSSPYRVVGVALILTGDYSGTYGLEDIRSCAPLSNNELVQLLRTFPGMVPHKDWELNLKNPVLAHALLNLLNVKYILTPPAVNVQEGLGFRLFDKSDLGIVENLDVWPRAFFTDTVVPISSRDEFIQHLLQYGNPPFAALTPREIATEPGLVSLQTRHKPIVSPATNYVLLPNSTAFDVHADKSGVVVLTEGQAKYFTATANGEPKTVLTVNRAFKGIYLDKPGDYHIQFIYRPGHWRLACTLFWLAIGMTIGLAFLHFAPRKFKRINPLEPPPNPDIPIP